MRQRPWIIHKDIRLLMKTLTIYVTAFTLKENMINIKIQWIIFKSNLQKVQYAPETEDYNPS